jgi:hypothetical protein
MPLSALINLMTAIRERNFLNKIHRLIIHYGEILWGMKEKFSQ